MRVLVTRPEPAAARTAAELKRRGHEPILLPLMQAQAGLSDLAAGWLAATNYLGYMSGALLAAWLESPLWRRRLYSAGLLVGLASTVLMALSSNVWLWALSRYLGGLAGAAGMLLGSGLVLGWLMRHGRRPELGLYFTGLGLGIVVSALGAMVMARLGLDWRGHWWGFAALGALALWPSWAWRPPVPVAGAWTAVAEDGGAAQAPASGSCRTSRGAPSGSPARASTPPCSRARWRTVDRPRSSASAGLT